MIWDEPHCTHIDFHNFLCFFSCIFLHIDKQSVPKFKNIWNDWNNEKCKNYDRQRGLMKVDPISWEVMSVSSVCVYLCSQRSDRMCTMMMTLWTQLKMSHDLSDVALVINDLVVKNGWFRWKNEWWWCWCQMIGSCYEELIIKKDFAKPDDDLRAEKPKRVKKIEKMRNIYNKMMARQKSKAEASTKNVVLCWRVESSTRVEMAPWKRVCKPSEYNEKLWLNIYICNVCMGVTKWWFRWHQDNNKKRRIKLAS